MKPYSDRRRRRDRTYPDARQAVQERSGGRCEAMLIGCTGKAEAIHHVAGRGGPDPHRLDNLKAVCRHCHSEIHMRPEAARSAGLMKSRMGEVRPSRWTQEDAS